MKAPVTLGERLRGARRDLRAVIGTLTGRPAPPVLRRGRLAESPPSRSAALASRPLRVAAVRRLTLDAIEARLVSLDGAPLSHRAGQFLTLLVRDRGELLRRAYSISSAPGDAAGVTIAVKRVAGGRVSNRLNDALAPGDVLDALGPSGDFRAPAGASVEELVLLAGGSGITPLLSIARDQLASRELQRRVTLIYGNRSEASVMYRDALDGLAGEHPERFRAHHVLEEAPPSWNQGVGRLDVTGVRTAMNALGLEADPGRRWLLCGPGPMMEAARTVLGELGVAGAAIAEERFQSPGSVRPLRASTAVQRLRVDVAGRSIELDVAPGQTLLEAGLAADAELPFSCAMGGCGACRMRLVSGDVALAEPNCLTEEERAAGVILTCSAQAVTDVVLAPHTALS